MSKDKNTNKGKALAVIIFDLFLGMILYYFIPPFEISPAIMALVFFCSLLLGWAQGAFINATT